MDDLDELEARIKKAQGKDEETRKAIETAEDDSHSRAGIRAGFELVGSIGISIALGYGLDTWLGTKPLFIIILFFLGVFAGFLNVYRVSQGLGSSVGYSELHRTQKHAKTAPELEKDTENTSLDRD